MRYVKLLKWAHTIWTLMTLLALVAAALDPSYMWSFYTSLVALTITTGFLSLVHVLYTRPPVTITTLQEGASVSSFSTNGGTGKVNHD